MLRAIFIGVMVMVLSACEGESKEIEAFKQRMCDGATWPNATENTAIPTAIQQRFAPACESIHLLEGIQFEGAAQAYLCRSFLGVESERMPMTDKAMEALPKREAVTAVFGAENALLQDGIMRVARFMGMYFSAVVLADAQGQTQKMITTLTELQQQKVTLESVSAAAGWAYLKGLLGEGYDAKALCKAEIAATSEGWKFDKANTFENCQPREWRNITVSREGKAAIVSREVQTDASGNTAALCID